MVSSPMRSKRVWMGILRAIQDPLPIAPIVSTACVLDPALAFPGSLSLCLGLSLFSLSLSYLLYFSLFPSVSLSRFLSS